MITRTPSRFWHRRRMKTPFDPANHLPTARLALLAVAATALLACTPLQTLSELSDNGAYRRVADLPYGSLERQRLDLYLPEPLADSAPLVVFFYGGAWRRGEKEDYEFVAAALTGAGLAVALPDYRVWPEVTYPAFVEDGAAALAWLESRGPEYGLDGRPVYLMGHSAGAHIAALLALDPDFRERAGAGAMEIAGLVGLSGPYDFLPLDEGSYLQEVFPPATREDSQPIRHVDGGDPPALLIHGVDDLLVEPGNSERLAEALANAGVGVTLRLYADRGHASVAAALAPPLDFVATTSDETVEFIREVEGREGRDLAWDRSADSPDAP
jgi:acetyl esterase/lipase